MAEQERMNRNAVTDVLVELTSAGYEEADEVENA
jgi:hypothetical protein